MFTALQSAHLTRANALNEARVKLASTVSLIVTSDHERSVICRMIDEIDSMLERDIPNTGNQFSRGRA